MLFRAGIRKHFLERHALDQLRVSHQPALDLLDTDHGDVQVVAQRQHGVHPNAREEQLVVENELGVEAGCGTLLQKRLKFFVMLLVVDVYDQLGNVFQQYRARTAVRTDHRTKL